MKEGSTHMNYLQAVFYVEEKEEIYEYPLLCVLSKLCKGLFIVWESECERWAIFCSVLFLAVFNCNQGISATPGLLLD